MSIPRAAALGADSAYLDAVAGREQQADVASLAPLLAPRSVVVVGASRREGSIGRTILLNIRGAGFGGAKKIRPGAAADVASLAPLLAPRSVAVVGASGEGSIGGRSCSTSAAPVRGEPACGEDRGCAVPAVGLRPAHSARPGYRGRAAGPGVQGGQGMREGGSAVPGGDHLRPRHRRGRPPAGDLPSVRDAPGRPELLRRRGAGPGPGRHLRRSPS